jgi:putative membrane protein
MPAAFRLDDPAVEPASEEEALTALEVEAVDAHRAIETIARPVRRGVRWGAVALSAGGALAALALGLALDELSRRLFDRAAWLGWAALALALLFALAVVVLIGREVAGMFRLKRLARLRLESDAAAAGNDRDATAAAVRALIRFYSDRPDLSRGRRAVAGHLAEIMDARDLLVLAERDLVGPLDARARALISAAARRVSVVTAVSPRAVFDVVFVLWESSRLIRRLAALYGGRPGTFGLFRLTKAVIGHLTVTGSLAVGDTLLQQIVGHGLAGRLSAKLGEGVVNGLMTARIGLSAMDVCRPLPFIAAERPRLRDLAGDLMGMRGEVQPT